MTSEDVIALLEGVARTYVPNEASSFRERALEDLLVFRHQPRMEWHPEKKRPPESESPPEHTVAFRIPKGYREEPELFLVFSSFVSYFLDPIACALHALRSFQKFPSETKLERIAFASEIQAEELPDELEFLDAERLGRDLSEMTNTVSQIGRHVFGDKFSLGDFMEAGGTNERD